LFCPRGHFSDGARRLARAIAIRIQILYQIQILDPFQILGTSAFLIL
jgi:hypothetical protein